MTNIRRQENLYSRVRAVWRRGQLLHVTAGMLAICRWGLLLFVAGVALDWMMGLPAPGRVVILVTLLGVSAYKAWCCGWRHARAFNAAHTALQIEEHLGGLESLLVSAVQLRDTELSPGTSESLRDLTCRRAEEAAAPLRPEDVVGFHGLRRPVTVAIILIAIIGAFAVVNGSFLAVGVKRIFAPWLDVSYPTRTQLALRQGNLVVKEGDSARIEALVSGVVPHQAQLELRTGKGRPRVLPLEITKGICQYAIASAFRGFKYRIIAGDARSPWQSLQVVPSPRVERVEVGFEFPPYMQRPSETAEALTFTVPEGTGIKWRLLLDRPINKAILNRDGEPPRPLKVSADGLHVNMDEVASASRAYSFSWVDKEHGFSFTGPRHYLQVVSDQLPHVELTSPAGNLNAMLGRPIDLVVRARDDHGIAATTIAYVVNLRAEKSFHLSAPVRSGGGDQKIDWDYRRALPDLGIGDKVSFVVELADRYPGPEGPHRARSEARRVTFLSREDYLKQIAKQRDRLLSRIRAVYRQERAAFGLVDTLDPGDDAFTQTCELEAVRQEMVRDRLKLTMRAVQGLIDDLAANNVPDAVEGASLARICSELHSIAETHVARAASLLRTQAGIIHSAAPSTPDPAPAALVINAAARELGGLVLQGGIDSAREVFARELHVFAQTQASLRRQSIEAEPDAAGEGNERLAKRQDELAQWTVKLLSDLRQHTRYTRRPLAVLGLTRRIKELHAAGIETKMKEAAGLIRQGRADRAVDLQSAVIQALLSAEFRVRAGAEYQALLKGRAMLTSLVNAQKKLRVEIETMTPEQFNKRRPAIARMQATFRGKLLQLLLPSIPAPRPQLFDTAPPQAPPVKDLLDASEGAMAQAVAQIEAGERKAAAGRQGEAEKSLALLAAIVNKCAVDLGLKTQGVSTLASAASDRAASIMEYETRQIDILDQTEDAQNGGKSCASLAEPQELLVEEIKGFRQELASDGDTLATPHRDVAPLLSQLDRVILAIKQAIASLRGNRPDEAIEYQEAAADALTEAARISQAQRERLGLFQDLLLLQRAVVYSNGYMADIVGEQRDLIAATREAPPASLPGLVPAQGNLRQCLVDVAPLLDLVAGRLDVGTPLLFAGSDMDDSIPLLQAGKRSEALEGLGTAGESLAGMQTLVQAVDVQIGYVAEVVEFLKTALDDGAFMVFRQEQLRRQTQAVQGSVPAALIDEQRALQVAAGALGQKLQQATGIPRYGKVAQLMTDAIGQMEAGDPAAAADKMQLAEGAINDNEIELFTLMTMLHGLPSLDVTPESPKEILFLVDVLALASEQRSLHRRTLVAKPKETASLASAQREIEARCKVFGQAEQPHPKLVAAHGHLSSAASGLKLGSRAKAIGSQQAAGALLRHFIVEQALLLETALAAGSASDPEAPPSEGEGSDLTEKLANFVSTFASGELPKNKRTEWQVLGRRNRAALNENFARELPLEYRGLLKDYYERVAK